MNYQWSNKMFLKLIPNRVKVWAIKHLYADIAAMGDGGDTQLAHVNEKEVKLLKKHGGAGTINPATGLREFKGKGGGSAPAKQESTSYSSNLPEYAKPYYQEQMKQVAKEVYTTDSAGNVTGVKGNEVYEGPRVAGFNADQTGAQDAVRGMTTPGQFAGATSGLNNAMTNATTAQGGISTALGYDPTAITNETVNTQKFTDSGVADSYMSPYMQNVVDVQSAEARRQADITKAGMGMQSIGRGTFGGGREALMQSEADRNLAIQLGRIQAEGSQNAYQQGQQAFQNDQNRDLSMQKANQAADLQSQQLNQTGNQFTADLNKQIGLGGLTAGLTGGTALGQLGGLEQQTDLQRIQAQAASGAEQQQLAQDQLNADQQQFMENANAKKAALEFQSNILRGNAGALGSTRTNYAPEPNTTSQIAGLGLAGLGLYNKLS
jgi:hypothetical protein